MCNQLICPKVRKCSVFLAQRKFFVETGNMPGILGTKVYCSCTQIWKLPDALFPIYFLLQLSFDIVDCSSNILGIQICTQITNMSQYR